MRELERDAAYQAPARLPRRIALVGRGRLGSSLAPALERAGMEVTTFGRAQIGGQSPNLHDAVLLCVPDAAIAEVAPLVRDWAPLVGHTSGATPLDHVDFGLHPLQTFTSEGASFEGIGCAIGGTSHDALACADAIARCLGMRPFELADADRPAYHAAASIASNFLVTIEAAAEQVAASVGVDRAALVPLVRQTVENWAAVGGERALTGPVARGDEATVERQRAAIEQTAPQLIPLWDELVAATQALSTVRRPLSTR